MNKEERIQRVGQLLKQGSDNIKKAGQLYAQMVRQNPEVIDIILRQDPTLTRADLEWFQAVGLGQVPDGEIVEKGIGIVEHFQRIKFN
jgi:hypothetical protein